MQDVKLNNNTYVSVGLVVLLISAIVFNQVQISEIKSLLNSHVTDKAIHRDMEMMRNNFVSRSDLQFQLENIELKMERILDKLNH